MNPSDPTTDLADFLANNGALDAALESASSMVPLKERKADAIAHGRAACTAALLALGAGQTTRDERASVERALLAAADSLAWFHYGATADYELAMSNLAAAGGFVEAARRVRRAVAHAGDNVVSPEVAREPKPTSHRRQEVVARLENADPASCLRKLPGACIPPGLSVPSGYEIDSAGVRTVKVDDVGNVTVGGVSDRPILVTGLLIDPDTRKELVVVRWHDGRAWRGYVASRSAVVQSRDLAGLSEYGLPVGSASAGPIAEWLEKFINLNQPKLPTARMVSSMGWRGLDTATPAFVLGSEVLRPGGRTEPSQLDDSDPTTWPDNAIHLRADDGALLAMTKAWRTGGTWEGWLELAKKATPHPALGLALRAAVAPMVLQIVGASNFVLDIAGITSQGKSTALYFAASAMGFPDDKQQGVVRPWNATRVSIERVSAFCADLPVLLDDTRQLSRKQIEDVSSVVYMVVNGQGRGRGTATGGVAATGSWHTVMLSTGETPITELAAAGGAAARTVSLFGSPLGGTNQEETARTIRDQSFQHYGHVARRVAFWLMGTTGKQSNRDVAKGWYAEALKDLPVHTAGDAAGRAVLARASDYVACLAVVGRILEEVGVPRWASDPQALAVDAMAATAINADRPTEALGVVYAWCCERPEAFYGRHFRDRSGEPNPPPGGRWLGAWDNDDRWTRISVNAEALRGLLRERRFDVEATLRTWAARKWIVGQTEGREGSDVQRTTKVVKVNGVAVRCVVLDRAALAAAELVDAAAVLRKA